MSNWIIYIPILIAAIGLGVSIWNARTSANKTSVDTKQTEVDKYVDALKGQLDIHEKEINDLKDGKQDLEKRMLACELARDDLAKRNVDLEREKLQLLTQLVTAGVVAGLKK